MPDQPEQDYCNCAEVARVSRRRFLGLAAATVAVGVLAACDSGTPAPATATNAVAQVLPTDTAVAPPPTATTAPLPPTATSEPPTPTATSELPTATAVPATATAALPSGDAAVATSIALADRPDLPVLCYHRIRDVRADDEEATKEMVVQPADFEQQIKYMVDNKYTFLNLNDVYRYYTDPTYTPPEKSVLITIDDGYVTAYNNGLPVLDKYGVKAAWFIMTIPLDQENFLTKDQVRALDKAGHYIAGHTYSHQNLPTKGDAEVEREAKGGKEELEEIVGHPIIDFAYPFGEWNAHVADLIRSYNFRLAYQLKQATDPQRPLYTVRRVLITAFDDMDTFVAKLTDPNIW